MGNQCGGPGRPCNYYIYPNATTGSIEDKTNRMLNYLVGITTPQQLTSEIQGWGMSKPWQLVYPLIFPPAIQYVYSLNSSMTSNNSGQVQPSDYTKLENPYYQAALVLQDVMAGAQNYGGYNLPCTPSYNVPFAMNNNPEGAFGTVIFEEIPNIPSPSGGGFDSCWNNMTRVLETGQNVGGNKVCVGDLALPTIGGPGIYPSTSYSQDYITSSNFLGYASGYSPLLSQFLTNPTDNYHLLFPQNVPYGPYDTVSKKPCVNLTDSTCTNSICHGMTPTGYNCQEGGKCNPQYTSVPPPKFKTLEDCTSCYTRGDCGLNKCCPQSQQGGVCPKATPPSPPNYTLYLVIGAISLSLLILLLVLGIRYGNTVLSSLTK